MRIKTAVISFIVRPYNLFDYNYGIYEEGPGYTDPDPHFGANYWMDWERPGQLNFMMTIKIWVFPKIVFLQFLAHGVEHMHKNHFQ
jgi:hypothetical protein